MRQLDVIKTGTRSGMKRFQVSCVSWNMTLFPWRAHHCTRHMISRAAIDRYGAQCPCSAVTALCWNFKTEKTFRMVSLANPPWWTFELRNAPSEAVGYPCEESDYPNAQTFSVFPKRSCFHDIRQEILVVKSAVQFQSLLFSLVFNRSVIPVVYKQWELRYNIR